MIFLFIFGGGSVLQGQVYNWTAIAGLAGTPAYRNGTNSGAYFNNPQGVTSDGAGDLYVADANNYVIRKISPAGSNWVTTTIAGLAGTSGAIDGTNFTARFSSLGMIQIDGLGNLYVQDTLNDFNGFPDASWIRKITPSGTNWITSTFFRLASSNAGWAIDATGNFYTASNYVIVEVAPIQANGAATGSYMLTGLAGLPGISGDADGTNLVARFLSPDVFGVDFSSTVYLTDNGKLRTVAPSSGNWVVTTVNQSVNSWMFLDKAGDILGSSGQYYGNPVDATLYGLDVLWAGATNWTSFGSFTNSTTLAGINIGANGNVYVADSGGSVIRSGSSASVQLGELQAVLQPTNAVTSGAAWQVDAGGWLTNGAIVTKLMAGNNHIITFAPVYGWTPPTDQWVSISNKSLSIVSGIYSQQYGALQVVLSPTGAVSSGAQWQVDGGTWQNSGSIVSNLAMGPHILSFFPAIGYFTPTNQNVNIAPGGTTNLTITYSPLGTVIVTITPTSAASAGAAWQLDGGGWEGSGEAVTNAAPGSHTISFLTTAGFITPSSQIVTVVSGTNNFSANYVALGAVSVSINPTNAATAGAQWQLDSGAWQASGVTISNVALGAHEVSFLPTSGFITPSNATVTVLSGQTTNVIGTYIGLGSVQVTISPTNAAEAGAQWALDGGAWQNSGVILSNLALGVHSISFLPVSNWTTPFNQSVTVVSGQQTNILATYVALGSLQVIITPLGAVTSGASWRVGTNAWQSSGTIVSNLIAGDHTIGFTNIAGWTTPANQIVTINLNQVTVTTGIYIQEFGNLQVVLTPDGVVGAGAEWQADGGAWKL
ncbi:MAG: hypothetical protein ABSH48_25480, partial [Verrucomicrobiota bacterium]